MTVLDGPLRGVAGVILARFGKPITYVFVDGGAYDASTDAVTQTTPDPITVGAMVEDYSPYMFTGTEEGVRRGDRKVTIAAKTLEDAAAARLRSRTTPTPNDRLVIDGETYQILAVDPVFAGEQAADYVLHARK